MSDLLRRQAATEKTLAKYRERRFDWRNRATCIHMARYHMRQMGHRPPMVPDFRSPRGARTALTRMGHDDLAALLTAMFERIAPAMMLDGDLALIPGEPDGAIYFDCIAIAAGGKLLGWHGGPDDSGIKPMQVNPDDLIGAWRL